MANSTKPKEKIVIKKIQVHDRRRFDYIKDFLCKRGDDFEETSSGSIDTIIFKGKEYVSVDLREAGGKGHHLNKIFRADIDSWLEEHGDLLEERMVDYKEQFFNLSAIEASLGEARVLIDINDCYWRTTYQKKYITQKTYIKGLKKKEWKTGRNACIGSLIKSQTRMPYTHGKPVTSLRRRIPSPLAYQYIRNDIIGSVYDMFLHLYEQLGDGFQMFLTDCVVTTYENKRFVEEFFKKHGYKTKSKPVEFTRVDRKNKTIHWKDFQAEVKNDKGTIIGHGKNRYYIYSTSQVVDGTTKKTINENTTNFNKIK